MVEAKSDSYALILHPTNTSILLLKAGEQWTLPRITATETAGIQRELQEQMGLDVTILDALSQLNLLTGQPADSVIYAVENHRVGWLPPKNAQWIGREELAYVALAVAEHRNVIECWLDEIEPGNFPVRCVPWARTGWFDEASAWITEQLSHLGYTMVAPIEQVHVRVWSTVFRVHTSGGLLYFKAVAEGFAHEPPLTDFLSMHWPEYVPHALAVDTTRRWMLMRHAGRPLRQLLLAGDAATQSANSVYLQEAFARYAQFQIETAAHSDTLLALGCPDRRLQMLPLLFEKLIADHAILLVGQKGGITEAELQQLHSFTPQVQEMCDELADYSLPETLHHDDFHTNNILINERGYAFFDWGDSAVTHPFCSMFIALRSTKYHLHYDDSTLLRLRDAYLEPWSAASSLTKEELLAAFALAGRLAMLSRTLTWYIVVAPLEERVKPEYEDAVPYWLKMFLLNREPDEA